MGIKVSEVQAQLADREAIRDTLIRYGRAVDRIDMDMVAEIFWPGATDDHGGTFNGLVTDLFDMVVPRLRGMQVTQHFLMNMLIEIDGDTARTETYVVAHHILGEDEGHALLTGGGRLLDVLTKRDDEWRVSERILVIDWMKRVAGEAAAGDLIGHDITGNRKPNDVSYRHFGGAAK